jgi:hypothetical protein
MSYFEHPERWEKLSDLERIENLYAICIVLFDLLNILCNEDLPFIKPTESTIELYKRLCGVYIMALSSEEAHKFNIPSLFDFPDLLEEKDNMQRHWFDLKPSLNAFVERLKAELIKQSYDQDYVSFLLKNEIILNSASGHIKDYKREKLSMIRALDRKKPKQAEIYVYPDTFYFDEKSYSYVAGDKDHVMRFRKNSSLGKIIFELDKVKGAFLNTDFISVRTKLKNAKVRSSISVLRNRINDNKLLKDRLQIDSQAGKGYKITPLNFQS